MATTPNYGWVTPAPTDLVTDLPADFETFADAVDADLAGLLGGTTGQVLAKDSATDHDFSWQTISAGGYTLLASGSHSGSATLSLTSIPSTYVELILILENFDPVSVNVALQMRFNSDTSTNYRTGTGTSVVNSTFAQNQINISAESHNATTKGQVVTYIPNYQSTVAWKMAISDSIMPNNTTPANLNFERLIGFWNDYATAISSIQIREAGGSNFDIDYKLYGVK